MIMIGIGVLTRQQLARIENTTRFAAESRVQALARLGDITRSYLKMRIPVRNFILAEDPSAQAAAKAEFDAARAELLRLLDDYADNRVTDDRDRRLLNDFRTLNQDWMDRAEQEMQIAAEGRREDAAAMLSGSTSGIGGRLSRVTEEWIRHNEALATKAGRRAMDRIEDSREALLIIIGAALVLCLGLGWTTFRSIAKPIQALQTSVEAIASGDYAMEVPYTQAADETGTLARSVDVLKQGAAAMEEQRWVKSHAAKLTGELQGAPPWTSSGSGCSPASCPFSAAASRPSIRSKPTRSGCSGSPASG